MSTLLFTHSYFYKYDAKQWKAKKPYPPLGTITAAAYLRKIGYEVHLFDTNLADDPSEIQEKINQHNPDYLVIYDDGFNYLTKMCLSLMRNAAFKLIEIANKINCTVLVSSSDSTDHYKAYLNQGADYILLGEAEETLKELIEYLDNTNTENPKIKGIAYKRFSEYINTGRRSVLDNLDDLPMAAWDLIKMEEYKKIWIQNHGYLSLNIATTRGCPYSCTWCAKPIFGQKYHARSPKNVVDEIELLINEYDANYFWICDDIFGLKDGWIREFRDLLISRQLRFRYTMQSRVDVMLKEDTISALEESGLDIVWVGAESGSQKILDSMEKNVKIDQIIEVRKKLKQHNIKVGFFIQFGYIGETYEDIKLTEKMLMDLMPDDIGISISYPLPGTKFYESVKGDLKQKANWNDSDDLALLFRNSYSPLFYKLLHRYIHKIFRKKQNIHRIKKFLKNPLNNHKGILRALMLILYYIPIALIYKLGMLLFKNSRK